MTDAISAVPLRVLIVGAGRRVRNNFLPVISCLDSRFSVVGVHSPTPVRRDALAAQWGLRAIESMNRVDFSEVDLVVISVPTSQNAVVLRQLLPWAASLSLIIDTPVAWTLRELATIRPLLRSFKRIAVAEDYMNFPQFALIRQAIVAGLIGLPRKLILTNTGYLYHGLALIRSFAQFSPIISSRRLRVGNQSAVIMYRMSGLDATVIGPYRQHTTGGIVLEGSAGTITEFAADREWSKDDNGTHLLRPTRVGGNIVGFEIEAGLRSLSLPLPALDAMRALDFPDKTELNLLRGCGLMAIFGSLFDTSNMNCLYTPRQAFYDSFVSRLAARGKLPFDPLTALGSDCLASIEMLSRAQVMVSRKK